MPVHSYCNESTCLLLRIHRHADMYSGCLIRHDPPDHSCLAALSGVSGLSIMTKHLNECAACSLPRRIAQAMQCAATGLCAMPITLLHSVFMLRPWHACCVSPVRTYVSMQLLSQACEHSWDCCPPFPMSGMCRPNDWQLSCSQGSKACRSILLHPAST